LWDKDKICRMCWEWRNGRFTRLWDKEDCGTLENGGLWEMKEWRIVGDEGLGHREEWWIVSYAFVLICQFEFLAK